jgi:hypothetical protein
VTVAYIVFVVAFVVLLVPVCAYLQARQDVKQMPREDFVMCEKHGPMPKKRMIKIDLEDGGRPIEMCPLCYNEKVNAWKNKNSKK